MIYKLLVRLLIWVKACALRRRDMIFYWLKEWS